MMCVHGINDNVYKKDLNLSLGDECGLGELLNAAAGEPVLLAPEAGFKIGLPPLELIRSPRGGVICNA